MVSPESTPVTIAIREQHGRYLSTVYGVPGYTHVRQRAGLDPAACAITIIEILASTALSGAVNPAIIAPAEVLALLPPHIRGRGEPDAEDKLSQ